MAEKLDIFSAMSLSYSINKNKKDYSKAFFDMSEVQKVLKDLENLGYVEKIKDEDKKYVVTQKIINLII
ncbi:hypothetical protein [Fusobacterium sp. PH5-44]|uniref:hypothetical protein n=1 Tax=unclassified Fusobacterium TaxID=2648384 RepID=UPI003D257870